MAVALSNPLFSGLLIHTAIVYRRQREEAPDTEIEEHVDPFGQRQKVDPFGQPTRDEEESHRLPCRFSTPRGGKVMGERSRDVVEVRGSLFLDLGADLREDDVVTVIGPTGATVVDRALVHEMELVHDGITEHHREATLVTQRPAR